MRDGEVVPACGQACPSEAIVFGNLNDKDSKISKYFADERNYHLLEELHTLPSVGYLTKIKKTQPYNLNLSGMYVSPIREPLIRGEKDYSQVTKDILAPMAGKPSKYWYMGITLSSAALFFWRLGNFYDRVLWHWHMGGIE